MIFLDSIIFGGMYRMKILFIFIFAIVIFVITYFASTERQLEKAALGAALAAVIVFVAPYIVEAVGGSDNKVIVEDEDVGNTTDFDSPNHEHKNTYEKKENIVGATCLNAGSYELVSYCECGEELSREAFTTEPLGHNYIATITEPSCEENGFTTYTCSRCRDSYVDEQTDTLGHDFVEEICSRCGAVSSEYEPLVISHAIELVNMGKYDEALNVVSEALNIISSDSLQQVLSNIQELQDKNSEYTAKNVEFITYNGSINSSDQTDTYSLDVPVTGYYRFYVSDMVSGFSVKIQVLDSAGAIIKGVSGISNGNGITCELVQGNSYTVKVIAYSNTGSYMLTIGQQKEIIDISTKEIVYDSIEYTDQQNKYTFIPAIDGTYRFDFTNIINGFSLKVNVYDSLGYKVGGYTGLSNGNGITVELKANEIYTIKVDQYSNAGKYTLKIGKQQGTQDITGRDSISGDVTYKDQKNIYILTPSSTGEYIFSLSNMSNGFSVTLHIYDSLDYKVGGYSGMGNDSKVTVSLTAGETYTIYLRQYSNTGSYNVNISRKVE